MRLRKGITVGLAVVMIVLLCMAVLIDRKVAQQQMEPVLASDAELVTNSFIVVKNPVYEDRLQSESVSGSSTLPADESTMGDVSVEETIQKVREYAQVVGIEDGFTMKIHNTKISVGYDTTEEALEERPGWLNTSAYPGENGVCIIYGHRNRKHLRALEKAEIGDCITISTDAENTFTYTICNTYIVDDLSEIAITSTDEPTLMLVTCYPFRYSGSAPQKYVVVAKQI